MLTRVLLVLLGTGLAAAATSYDNSYNNNYRYQDTTKDNQTKIFCYINGTRVYQKMPQYRIENNLNVELCHYIVYGGARINSNHEIEALEPELEHDSSRLTFKQIMEYRDKNLGRLKSIVSISGSHTDFSAMARASRERFINSVKMFMNKHRLDGVNIDWQYPAKSQEQYDDKANYVSLMNDLKAKIRDKGSLLTAVLPATRLTLDYGYQYHNSLLMENVDYWFIMAMEYYNHAFASIGANAPIIGRDGGKDVTSTIDYILSKEDFARDHLKLILVVPFYGKQYMIRDDIERGATPFGAQLSNVHTSGTESVLSYPEVCRRIQPSTGDNSWMRGTDAQSKTPYAVKDKQAVLYEDTQSVTEKTNLALRKGLGGVMAYSLDLDDYEGQCAMQHTMHTSENRQRYNQQHEPSSTYKYPLLQAMHDAVQKGPNGSVTNTGSMALLVSLLAVAFLTIHG